MLKVRKFLASDYFNIILAVTAFIIVLIDQELGTPPVYYGLSVYYGIMAFTLLVLTDDLITFFASVLILGSFIIQYKNSYDFYISYLWIIPYLAFTVIFHIVAYRKKDSEKIVKKNPFELELFKPMAVASMSIILGGVGIMTVDEYFSAVNVLNFLALGPLALLFYVIFYNATGPGKNYTDHIDERISKIFITVSVFLIFSIFEYYGENWYKFLENPNVLPFQWRNNACTLLMISMPFSFYMAQKKHFAYITVSVLSCVAFVLSGSRGGLLFGAIEFLILIIYFAKVDVKHRKYYIAILAAGVIASIVFAVKFSSLISYTVERFTSDKENFRRIGLWQRSVEDFKANPLFGRGMGYMGNRDIHPSKKGLLCWYHSSLPQVWGSLGLFGLFAYGYQFFCRIRFFVKRNDLFAKTVFFSFIGLELMSLVNPGIFAPAYLVIITVLFAIVEKNTSKEEQKI